MKTLGFCRLNLDVTIPRVVMFRGALLGLLPVELGDKFATVALEGWKVLLDYVGRDLSSSRRTMLPP